MRHPLIRSSIFLLLASLCVFSTTEIKAQKGFVKGKSLYMRGTLTKHSIYSNNREIQFVKEEDSLMQIFHPADLTEFRFDNGDIYVTKLVDDDGVKNPYFLLEHVRGNANLFLLRTRSGFRYFGETKNGLVELKSDSSFHPTLLKILNRCPAIQSSLPLVKRTKPSVSRAFSLHNRCYNGAFPRTRVGFNFGYSSTIFAVKDLQFSYVPVQGLSPFFSLFIETPTGLGPRWFANFQIQYQQTSYRTPVQYKVKSNFQISTTSLNFPVLLKYRSTGRKFRTFVLAGPSISYLVKYQSYLLETISSSGSSTVFVRRVDNISQVQINAMVAMGTEYSLNLKNSIGLELRYSAGSGTRGDDNQRVSSWQVIGSVFF